MGTWLRLLLVTANIGGGFMGLSMCFGMFMQQGMAGVGSAIVYAVVTSIYGYILYAGLRSCISPNEIYSVATTGALVYTTSVRLIAAGRGFLLDETLEQHNGGKACSGAPASEVLQHLEAQAYIEIGGDTLRYYRHQGDPAYIAFVRTDV